MSFQVAGGNALGERDGVDGCFGRCCGVGSRGLGKTPALAKDKEKNKQVTGQNYFDITSIRRFGEIMDEQEIMIRIGESSREGRAK